MNFSSSNSENHLTEIAPNSIPKLPDDVVIEILTRLPAKPLLKFRCVCKSWLSIISSHQFIKTHLTNSKKDPNFTHHRIMLNWRANLKHCSARSLLYEPFTETFNTDFTSQSSKNSIWVLGSCDGLICLAIDKKELILWNPTTRIFKTLPDFGVKTSFRSNFAYGLGFDKSSDDYKVVGFFNSSRDFSEVIGKVYSLKADQCVRNIGIKTPLLLTKSSPKAHQQLTKSSPNFQLPNTHFPSYIYNVIFIPSLWEFVIIIIYHGIRAAWPLVFVASSTASTSNPSSSSSSSSPPL
ncbi:hypothetical protein CASFOL_004980 [Castilleja foliolosa]|uniref:F-box domain-containing protein n=1 Tax=Castilleja foliolosa TaxID=1961234 RepID=A0ABD3E474_9LAMI